MNMNGLECETVDMFYRLGLIKDTAIYTSSKPNDIKNLERMGGNRRKHSQRICGKEVPFERCSLHWAYAS